MATIRATESCSVVTMMSVRIENGKPTARWGRKARGLVNETARLPKPGPAQWTAVATSHEQAAGGGGFTGATATSHRARPGGARHPGSADRSESIRVADGGRCGGQYHHGGSEVHRPRPDHPARAAPGSHRPPSARTLVVWTQAQSPLATADHRAGHHGTDRLAACPLSPHARFSRRSSCSAPPRPRPSLTRWGRPVPLRLRWRALTPPVALPKRARQLPCDSRYDP
jgi:hypothetical protein